MEEEKNAAEPQESNGCPQESRVKGEEPSTESLEEVTNGRLATQRRTHRDDAYYPEEDIIYDISESSENSENDVNSENSDNADNTESLSEAETSLREMVAEMGAERVLEIIRDNRNAAIRQILSEVEAQRGPLQSGVSVGRACSSIFDLAALA